MFTNDLILKKIKGHSHMFELAEELIWEGGDYGIIVVPKGFFTDLSTYWLEGKHTRAAIVHDYVLYDGHTRAEAADIMNLAMQDLGVSWARRNLILIAIRSYNGWVYTKNFLNI